MPPVPGEQDVTFISLSLSLSLTHTHTHTHTHHADFDHVTKIFARVLIHTNKGACIADLQLRYFVHSLQLNISALTMEALRSYPSPHHITYLCSAKGKAHVTKTQHPAEIRLPFRSRVTPVSRLPRFILRVANTSPRGARRQGSGEDYITRNLMTCTHHQILFG
jgi:hypothetical protein